MTNTNARAPFSPSQSSVDVRRRRQWLSVATACAVIVVGALALVASRDYQYWTPLGPGPGFFPRWLGGLLVVFGASWLVQLWRQPRSGADHSARGTETNALVLEEEAPEYSLSTVVAIVVSLCVLAAVLETLGYQLSMLLFSLFHLLVLGRRRLLLSAVIAVVASFGVFVVFTRFLSVPLPASSMPFLRDLGL